MPDVVIVDASATVEALLRSALGRAVRDRLDPYEYAAPAHHDAEVLSALGRLQRAGSISEHAVGNRIGELAEAPIARHPLPPLLRGAWRRRHNLRLADALYVELAHQLGLPLVTTDRRLAQAWRGAELVSA